MRRRIIKKWRPSLAIVVGVVQGTVVGLSFAGIVAVRYLWPVMGYREAVFAVFFTVLVVAAVLGWMLVRVLLRPVKALVARSAAIKAGEDGALDPLPHYGTAEMQHLGQAMLDMGRVLQGREAVLRSYADHVTHELRSPLTVLRGAAELLDMEGLPEAERRKLVDRIDQATDRMTALLDAQRALARAQEPFANGSCLVGALAPEWEREYPGLSVEVEDQAEVPLSADGVRLVMDHLLGNAAAHGATTVRVLAGPDVLRVSDDGPGISAGNRTKIFDPFFTTRRSDGGTGMGLPIVQRMLAAHGAEIELVGDTGAVFEIRF